MQILGNHYFQHSSWHNLTKIIALNADAKETITLNSLQSNLTKFVTLNANTRGIITLNTFYGLI